MRDNLDVAFMNDQLPEIKIHSGRSVRRKEVRKGSQSSSQPSLTKLQQKEYFTRKFQNKILREETQYKVGELKFYNGKKQFGFVTCDGVDYFIHEDDLQKALINPFSIAYQSQFFKFVMKFRVVDYMGKIKTNKKAIDISIVSYYGISRN